MDSSNGSLVVVGSKNERLVPGLRFNPCIRHTSIASADSSAHLSSLFNRYRVDHKDVVYFGSCAVMFMLPIAGMTLTSITPTFAFSPLRTFASLPFGPQSSALEMKPDTSWQPPQRLPYIAPPIALNRESKQQLLPAQQPKQKKQDLRRAVSTPTMSDIRQSANEEVRIITI